MVNPVENLKALVSQPKYSLYFVEYPKILSWAQNFNMQGEALPGWYFSVTFNKENQQLQILVNGERAFLCNKENLPTQMHQIEKILDGILL